MDYYKVFFSLGFIIILNLDIAMFQDGCNATQRLNDTQCGPDPCVNGVCKEISPHPQNMYRCFCDPGWIGEFILVVLSLPRTFFAWLKESIPSSHFTS